MKKVKITIWIITAIVMLCSLCSCGSSATPSESTVKTEADNLEDSSTATTEKDIQDTLFSSLLTPKEYTEILIEQFPVIKKWEIISNDDNGIECEDGLGGYFELTVGSCTVQLFGTALGLEDPSLAVEVSYIVPTMDGGFSLSVSSIFSLEQAVSLALEVFSDSPAAITTEEFLQLYNTNVVSNSSDQDTKKLVIKGIEYEVKEGFGFYTVNASLA